MYNIKLNKNSLHLFKVEINHGNDMLNHEKKFSDIAEFKAYVKSLSTDMLKIRTVTIKDLTTFKTLGFKLALRGVDTKTKFKI
jgi:hypothetical protein